MGWDGWMFKAQRERKGHSSSQANSLSHTLGHSFFCHFLTPLPSPPSRSMHPRPHILVRGDQPSLSLFLNHLPPADQHRVRRFVLQDDLWEDTLRCDVKESQGTCSIVNVNRLTSAWGLCLGPTQPITSACTHIGISYSIQAAKQDPEGADPGAQPPPQDVHVSEGEGGRVGRVEWDRK
jgi:hypothetical protein